jgi:predicted permease
MDTFWQDLRHGLYLLRSQPGFALVSILTLAIGIGANTTLFSVANAALLRPTYATAPAELVSIFNGDRDGHGSSNHAWPDYRDLRDNTTPFLAGLAAFTTRPVNLLTMREVERINVGLISAEYFHVLGIAPIAGRDFRPEENEVPGAHPVALISESLWRRQFGATPQIATQQIWLNNAPYAVVGVIPDAAARMAIVVKIDVFVPAMMQGVIRGGRDYLSDRRSADFMLIGRLRPGVTQAQAQAGVDRAVAGLAQQDPDAWRRQNRPRPITVVSERDARGLFELRGFVLGFTALLMGGVGAVLLIACANLANVLLARGLTRRQELAVRVSLGASRARLVRQLLTETLVLAVSGGIAGFLAALWAKGLFRAFEPRIGVPLVIDLSLDLRVFAFSAAVTLVAAIAFGLAPALQVTSPRLVSSLQEGQRTATGGRHVSRLRSLLLIGQVAVSVLLLACAAIFVRGLAHASEIDLGFVADRVDLLSVDLSMQGYNADRGSVFTAEAVRRLREVPGVVAVDAASRAPLGLSSLHLSLTPEGQTFQPEERPSFGFNRIGPDYFRVMGIPLVAGRAFTADDRQGAARVVIINDVAARRFWPNESAIGRRVTDENGTPLEIVGVAKTSKYDSLTERQVSFAYLPLAQQFGAALTFHVLTSPGTDVRLDDLRRVLTSLDPRLPIFDVTTLQEHVAMPLLPYRLAATLLGLFGLLALGLACLGLHGSLAYFVNQRRREIGIRRAIGADARDVMRMVLAQGLRPLAWGMLLGLLPCVVLLLVLQSEVYRDYVPTLTDIAVLCGVFAVQAAFAVFACWLPARRALRLDPAVVLRGD